MQSQAIDQVIQLWRSGREQQAKQLCESLAASREDTQILSLLAEMHVADGRADEAVECLQRLARTPAADAGVHRRLGNALLAIGSAAEAVASYRTALAIEPASARGHNNLGQALMQLQRFEEARASYQRAIELDPRYAIAHNNLGVLLYKQGECEAALACYRRALELDPSLAEAHNNCGNALLQLDAAQQALQHYEQALSLRPALFSRGNEPSRPDPGHAEALSNCASALLCMKRPEEALRYCERALALKHDLVEAHNNLGGALRQLRRFAEASAAFERALQIKADYAPALSNLAHILLAHRRYAEAIAYCDRAIALQAELAEAHDQRALALLLEKRPDEAVRGYARLLQIEPHYKFAAGALFGARLACCDWEHYQESCEQLSGLVQQCQPSVQPFTFLSVSQSSELQLRCARTYAEHQLPAHCRLAWSGKRHQHERVRIAYLSADFHQHATAILATGLFEAHDRERFETIAVSFGPDDSSPMRHRLQAAFERFIDVREFGDAQAVQLLRSMEVDIAVDLKGYTADCRPGILARRAAPIQVSYLGYPGSMGLEQIDYLLADRIVLPPEQHRHFSEQIVYLPHCYQVNDNRRPLPQAIPTRLEAGLPATGFVFCCFNHSYKITPTVFEIWLRLLQRLPGSVLWLLEDNAAAPRNLRREAQRQGVDGGRLVFAPRVGHEQHLARHCLADLFLDTLPYNAHTTSSDALWAGLPVLTCLGDTFPGRVAASLLAAIGLPELITLDLRHYEARAFELASDPLQLGALRSRLAENRNTEPLFDTARFCRQLESAYTRMWQRYQSALDPQGFSVEPQVTSAELAGIAPARAGARASPR
jgi:predicted O-linked N-acetylglucosamine transferase (SPINDLY family)